MAAVRFSTHARRWLVALLPMVLCCFLLTSVTDAALAATKMLLFSPVRIIFTEKQRSIDVHVSNTADEPITYTISLVTMRKDTSGKLSEVKAETEQEQAVKKMLRYSPRRATIEPGKRQIVKLMVQKPDNLPPGEYQTRLSLSPLPGGNKHSGTANTAKPAQSAIQIEMLVTSTLPIIIQHGVEAKVTPLSLTLKEFGQAPSGLAAEVKLARNGDASGFGNVRLSYVPAQNSQTSREIGRQLGLALYLPDTNRTVTIPLAGITRKELSSGMVRVEFEPDTGAGVNKRGLKGEVTFKDFPVR